MNVSPDERLRSVIALHFDPRDGAAYWLNRAAELRLDAVRTIRSMDDLACLGPMDKSALWQRPVEDFVPRKFHERKREWIVGETGGTLGRSSFAVHREDEFHAAFVEPFASACRRIGFPSGANWLFIGPSGPHIIGKAARACARALNAMDPFSVDFDPRWARKLPPGTAARERYLAHIEAQALDILGTQNIGVLFATPPVLESLGEKIDPSRRAAIRGIHFGGMVVQTALREKLGVLFPNSVQISGYGNTLFGVAPELRFVAETGIDYFACGTRLIYRVVDLNIKDERERLASRVAYGQRGPVLAHRLDETHCIPNMLERDAAVRVAPPSDAAADGFVLDGLRDPQPIVDAGARPALGLY